MNYKINVSNNTNETLALYCYKYIDSTAKFTVVNEKGKVVYYDNLAKQETPFVAATINRVYSIYIKVSKGNSYYEIKSDKAMVR
ncbi:hypothetical protein SDC9_174163 [bioreactor metagenome]|uniref:Uncharacterized protein n=1 Tax=bioreactor metagenome TaxID=1076179 RepID=A0A645GII6_9ZZZZ